MTTKSGKHTNKIAKNAFDSAANNGVIKAVDMRKVAALSAGAAGVIAGAAIAFGATPAMAAETSTPAPVNADSKKEQSVIANKDDANKNDNKAEGAEADGAKAADNKTNADSGTTAENAASAENGANEHAKSDLGANQNQGEPVLGTDRGASTTPESKPQANSTIELSKDTKDTLPNMYAWGKSDNVYIESGQNQSVTFKFAKPDDGSTITKVAIFPSDTNGVENTKSRGFLEYYSDDLTAHKPYSGEYSFTTNQDGSATLTMSKLYRDNNMAAEKYAANRCVYVYGKKDGKDVLLYKTNIARAATLVPPKTAGSIVLQYDEQLTDEQIRAKLKTALDAPTEAKDGKSLRDQITAASKSFGVGGRTGEGGKFVQTPDAAENKVVITDNQAYAPTELAKINKVDTSKTGTTTTYVTGAQTLKTYLISDLGYKSEALPLTVARYDTRIDKPIVEDTDPSKVSDEVKTEIKKKLARLNHVPEDKVTIGDDGTFTISFDGVDAADAPKIALRDLVLKKLAEADVNVPTGSEATFVANPLGYSNAELDRIKTAIFNANKDNKDLGLTSVDQITLEYVKGDTTVGHENIGISNGQAENKITVKIKTDKAVAEFTSNVKESKLTKLPNIRTDYDVTWTKTKIDGRDTDEGISWSNDSKTTIIYRYDPTKAEEFDTTKILGLLKATPKDGKSGLRELQGGEQLDHEDSNGKPRKSHMHYALQNDEPTGELTLGNMGGAYWSGNQKVSNSDVDLGDNLSISGSYSWDPEAGSVTVAGKKDKIFKARLFVEPYAMTYYKDVYLEQGRNPGNTAKAINVIFVPQTNHKTSDLQKSIGEHATTQVEGKDIPTDSKYYNASDKVKKDYEDALKVAKQTLEKVGKTADADLTEDLKAEVDNATIKLDKARKALDGDATKKEELNKSIEANGKTQEGQTPASGTQATDRYKNVTDPDFKDASGNADTKKNEAAKKAKEDYDKALEDAKALKDDQNATQKAVDEAKAKLDAARAKLNDFTTSKDKLNAAIAEHGQVNTGDAKLTDPDKKLASADPTYQNSTPEQRKAYDEAVKKANELSKDPNASQKEVNAAIEALEAAKKALDAKATDKSQLITAEKLSFDNPDKTDASKQSTFYKNALNKKDNGANDQEKQAAKTAVENYDNALQKAREVIADKNATQAQVDAAKDALTKAEDALHKDYATNADELTKALADNFSGYLMPAYFNAFDKAQTGDKDAQKAFKDYNDAYQKAKELKENLEKAKTGGKAPTQTQINEAKTALEEARKVIDKYATNTSRLSAAAFNDIAIQKSPAYKNVSADDASEEAKEAKKKYDAAVEKLHKALANNLPKDSVPDSNTPKKDGNLNDKDYLKDIQAHKNGEPLDRDVDAILKEMNAAAAELNKFATKTDELLKSVNEHDNTQQTPAFKNANQPDFKNGDGTTADKTKNDNATAAANAYGAALNAAKELLKNPAATQKEVNDALKKLDDARKELDKYNTDTTKLVESVKKHGSTEGAAPTEGTQTSDAYRNASDPHFLTADGKPDTDKNAKAAAAKKAYDEALTKAQDLLKKHDDKDTPQDAKPTQKDINAALKALDDARTDIEKYKTVTTDLEKEINKSTPEHAAATEGDFENTPEFKNAKAKTSNGAENADVTAYKEALKKARDLAKAANPTDPAATNSSHPTQKQINDALDALKAAKKQITDNYKTKLEPLTAAKDFAGGDFKNTPEYKNAVAKKAAGDQGATAALGKDGEQTGFDNVLKKVTEKLNDEDWKKKATQKDVNALLKQLQEAQEKIAKEYKTDAIKLEREVGDKDQDGKPVVPPFESSVAYKNALEKAKTEDAATTDPNSATKKLEAYNEKLKAAQELLNKVNKPDPNAKPEDRPTQKQVDDALAALKKAKKDIDDNFKTKVDKLQNEVDDKNEDGTARTPKFEESTEFANLKGKTKDGKKPDDLVAYEQALAKAKELIDKNDGKIADPNDSTKQVDVPKDQLPTQQEVDEAQKALKEIKDKILANHKTNPHDLQEEVDLSKDGDDDKRDTTFENTPEFKNADAKKGEDGKDNTDMAAYKKALADAKALLDKFDRTTGKPKTNLPAGEKAPTQKELDKALDALKAAKQKITDGYKTNPSKLKSEADADPDFTKTPEYVNAQAKGDDASKKDLEAYKKALEDANKVLGDKNATQKQVDDALKKLQDAKSKLTDGYKTDKNKLDQETGNDPEFRKSIPFLIADSKDIAEYNKALNDANAVLNNPNATQAQVDEALRKLQRIKQKMIDLYNSLGSGSDDDSDGGSTGANNANANAVDKSMLHAEVNGALADVANGAGAAGAANGAKGSKGALVDASVIKEFNDALENARRVLADPNATQEQVEAATMRLRAARAALNAAKANKGSNLRGNMGVQTGVDSATLSAFAAVFVGLAGLGVSAKRRKHASK